MNLRIVLFIWILVSAIISIGGIVPNSFVEIRQLTNLNTGQKLIVTFQEVGGNCVKCYDVPVALIESLKARIELSNIKIVAAVKCNRDIELNVFKKQYDWNYYIYADKKNLAKQLGVKPISGLAVFDYSGKLLLELEAKKGVFAEDIDKLENVLK